MVESLFINDAGLATTLLKRHSSTSAFCEYCEIFKCTYFEEVLQTTAFEFPLG